MSARALPDNTTPGAPTHPVPLVADDAAEVPVGGVRFMRGTDEGTSFRSLSAAGTWLRTAGILDVAAI